MDGSGARARLGGAVARSSLGVLTRFDVTPAGDVLEARPAKRLSAPR